MDQVKVMTPVRAWLHLDLALLLCSLLASCCRGPAAVGAVVPAAPVNVSVTQLRAHSAMVTWSVPQGDTVIGYAISQQRQDGLMQRFIREVNTSSHWCVLWDLDEDTHYSVQVQSVGLQDDSQPSRTIQFRTLERTDHYPAGVLDHHEPAMEGLDMTPQLQTGELLIITTVLLLWAGKLLPKQEHQRTKCISMSSVWVKVEVGKLMIQGKLSAIGRKINTIDYCPEFIKSSCQLTLNALFLWKEVRMM
ncbi:fibronectin type III domain-containing protein 4 isoform X3 [Gadus morhua]|uniref:fibronectin type III domain-containing protein 4 isoform X3 n=1 Tax=Gadus morhua TaxID=8049 RepID=UPI0011B82D07|nr:fibronectin type III domain-containing protein 4-like isoform X3 [Gadus morhua]